MKTSDLRKKVTEYMNANGISDYGFVNAKPLVGYANFVIKNHFGSDFAVKYDVGYNKESGDRSFYDPSMHLDGVKSVITVILPYHMDKIRACDKEAVTKRNVGKISKASIFTDYHMLLGQQLELIASFIKEECGGEAVSFCDTGPLNDKAMLLRTGQFKVLRNSLLFHKVYGSRFYIGYVMTDLQLFDDDKEEFKYIQEKDLKQSFFDDYEEFFHPFCKTCGRCAKACPNQAIVEHGHLKSSRCISYLTQTNDWDVDGDKPKLSDELTLNGQVYGCDICQQVCPLNGMDLSESFFYETVVSEWVIEEDIRELTNRQFKEIYNKSSAGWIGKKRFLRNLRQINHENEIKD